MASDQFPGFVHHGLIASWLPEAHDQNSVVIQAAAAAAGRLSTVVAVVFDGMVGRGSCLRSRPPPALSELQHVVLLPSQRNGRITVIVSHRFSTVRMADLILVIEGTRLTEIGTHDELLAHNGTYADLYRTQANAYR
ncbi:MAG: hypothetical protein ACR2F6_02255 [Mycobacteriales bacterium]